MTIEIIEKIKEEIKDLKKSYYVRPYYRCELDVIDNCLEIIEKYEGGE